MQDHKVIRISTLNLDIDGLEGKINWQAFWAALLYSLGWSDVCAQTQGISEQSLPAPICSLEENMLSLLLYCLLTFSRSMSCLMSNEQKLCKVKIFQLQSI